MTRDNEPTTEHLRRAAIVDAQECGEPNTDDLTVDGFATGQTMPLLHVSITCGHIDHGPPLLAPLGALDQVHLAAGPDLKFDFSFFCFSRFCSKLAKIISGVRSIQMR